MDRIEARNRIEELRRLLEENSRRYYVDNAPAISDFEFDTLMHELENLEAAYPEFDSPDSPTRKVGSDLDAPLDGNAEPQARTGFVQRNRLLCVYRREQRGAVYGSRFRSDGFGSYRLQDGLELHDLAYRHRPRKHSRSCRNAVQERHGAADLLECERKGSGEDDQSGRDCDI